MTAAILNAPKHVRNEIDMKQEASTSLTAKTYDFIHAFFGERQDLDRRFSDLKAHLAQDGLLWISWKKKSAAPEGDLNENVVREIGLREGLVDVKVCSVDENWSGLKFVYRKSDRAPN